MKTLDQLPLNDLQLSLLRMFSHPISEEQTLKIKRMLVQFLSDELDSEIERVVQKKRITDDDFDKLRNEHQRSFKQ